MKQAFIINGAAGVGKDLFVDMVREHLAGKQQVFNISSVDKVKEAALILGWDGIKDSWGRNFLSDLKDLSTNAYDGPAEYMLEAFSSGEEGIYFFHIREPEEIQDFYDTLCDREEVGADTVLIKRSVAAKFDNHADAEVEDFVYDVVIDNQGSYYKLVKEVEAFCDAHIMEPVIDKVKEGYDFAKDWTDLFKNSIFTYPAIDNAKVYAGWTDKGIDSHCKCDLCKPDSGV